MVYEWVLLLFLILIQGQRERDQCYKPILEELEIQFPNHRKDRYLPSVIVSSLSVVQFSTVPMPLCRKHFDGRVFFFPFLIAFVCDFCVDELMPHFPDSPPACLVPGAGLGRLALDISCLGMFKLSCCTSILNISFSNV